MSDTDDEEDADDEKRYQHHHYRVRPSIAFLWTAGQTLWASLLFGAAFVKILDQGVFDFVRHYTNFSWTLQAFFYLVTAPDPLAISLGVRSLVRLETLFIGIFLMPLFGVVVLVAVLVIILLATKAQAFIDIFAEYPSGIVIIGNDVYHFVPVIAILFYIMFNRRHVFYALNCALQTIVYHRGGRRHRHHRRKRYVFSFALYLYQAYFGTLITLLIYSTFFDPRIVYGTDIGLLSGILLIVFSLTLSNAIPLAIAAYGWGLGSRHLDESYLFGPEEY